MYNWLILGHVSPSLDARILECFYSEALKSYSHRLLEEFRWLKRDETEICTK
jgi:hypothetical protein